MFPGGVLEGASVLVAPEYYLTSQSAAETMREKIAALIKIARTLEDEASA